MPDSGSMCFGRSARRKLSTQLDIARDLILKNVMLRNITFPRLKKNFLRLLLFALCGFAGTTFADDFKSMTIAGGTSSDPIRVHGDQFMVIRNFTQEGGSDRGFVMVTKLPSGDTANILTAAILDTTTTPPDVINNVVIAGPADITVTCGTGATGCFISYKKDSN
jgi:hypothetical protein